MKIESAAPGHTHAFGADVSRLLDIVAHALYSNRDIFLRELISNASDACDKLRYEAIAAPERIKDDPDFRIRVFKDAKARTLTVLDNGIGMDRDALVDNLGTIAKSGTAALAEKLGGAADGAEKLSLIGQFGVGFYASFMVADTVTVVSRKAGDAQGWVWESDGRTGFSVREAEAEEHDILRGARGTAVILHIADDASDFLIDEKLRNVIETWSDHINIPIFLDEPEDGAAEQPVNAVNALWMRPKDGITDEQHTAFFRHLGLGADDPLLTCHWRAEGKMEYTALLYVPTLRPMDMYDPGRRHAVRLYVKRVFITDECKGLVYPWLRFLRGVIDSEDLPLNISREMLQHNPMIDKIRDGVARRVLGDLAKLAEDDPVSYAAFWGQFGAVLKEGLYDAFAHREALLKIARFPSTHENGALTSLTEYAARMKEGQDRIFYLSGENLDTLKNSPQIEGFRARGLEVLFFTDTIDDFWLQTVLDYDGKPFQSVTKGGIDLSRFPLEAAPSAPDAETAEDTAPDAALDALRGRIETLLAGDVAAVRFSDRLTDSPVCLVADDKGVDLRMERVLRLHHNYKTDEKRILEINPRHPLIRRLAALSETAPAEGSPEISDAAALLLNQARIIQGEPIPDPARFARSLSRIMEKSL